MDENRGAFSLGGVLSASFDTFLSRFVHFVPLALLCYTPLFLLLALTGSGALGAGAELAQNIVDTICASIFASIATYEVVMRASGRQVTLGQTLSAVTPRIVTVILASIVFGLLMALGLALFVIPGLYIMTCLFVIVPAIVVENLGLGACYSRSSELTRGYRWPIFGLVLILLVAAIGLTMGSVFAFEAMAPGVSGETGVLIGLTVVGVIVGVFNAIVTAHTFVQLRIAKEGASVQELADVFS
jgi:hypothetical protein